MIIGSKKKTNFVKEIAFVLHSKYKFVRHFYQVSGLVKTLALESITSNQKMTSKCTEKPSKFKNY